MSNEPGGSLIKMSLSLALETRLARLRVTPRVGGIDERSTFFVKNGI